MSVIEQCTQEELFINELIANIEAGEYDDTLAKLHAAVKSRLKSTRKRTIRNLKNHVGEKWYINELFPDIQGTPVRIEKVMVKNVVVVALRDNSFCTEGTRFRISADAIEYDEPSKGDE